MTATSPQDYIEVSSQLVSFAQGEVTKALDIRILDDDADEGEESFVVTLRLHGPSRPSAALGPRNSMTIIIQDNDGVLPTPQGL